MRNHTILLSLLASLTAAGCKSVECAEGTIERDGQCEPANNMTDPGICGPFTELIGDRCVPQFPPTICEPGTTEPQVDPETGVTTCKGTGISGGCDASIVCPTPSGATKQSICGQLYDFETMAKLQGPSPTGAKCDPSVPTASGPCALTISAYDAIAFATDPSTAQPLQVGSLTIDDCGRYAVGNIETSGTGPFIGIGVDDATGMGPTGVTVTAAVAVPKVAATTTPNLEAFIVKPSTTQLWANSGGPTLQTGIYATVFRKHKLPLVDASFNPFEPQPGVTIIKGMPAMQIPSNDFYFGATVVDHTTIDPAATATGVNGTGLVNNASVAADSVSYQGQGGLGAGCRWELHAGASLPGIVFIQVFRKADVIGQTCND